MLRYEENTSPASLDIKKLGAYVAGAGALSMTPGAEAVIVYQTYEPPLTAIDPSSINRNDVESIDIDLSTLAANVTTGFPTLGDTDLRLTPQDAFVKTGCTNCPKNKTDSAQVTGGIDVAWATNVALGDILGPGTAWFPGGGSVLLPGGTDRYLGLRRTDGTDQFYGWLRYSEGSATLFEAAIENSSDTPIRVGDVPVPATLALLVSGAAGLAASRRRRKLNA